MTTFLFFSTFEQCVMIFFNAIVFDLLKITNGRIFNLQHMCLTEHLLVESLKEELSNIS